MPTLSDGTNSAVHLVDEIEREVFINKSRPLMTDKNNDGVGGKCQR